MRKVLGGLIMVCVFGTLLTITCWAMNPWWRGFILWGIALTFAVLIGIAVAVLDV